MSNHDSSNAADRFDSQTIGGVTTAYARGTNPNPSNTASDAGINRDNGNGVHRGSSSYQVGAPLGAGSSESRVTQASSASLIDTTRILGTYRSLLGSPSQDFKDNGTVAVDPSQPDGLRTSVANAVAMGLIRRGPGGMLIEGFDNTPTADDIEQRLLGNQEETQQEVELFTPQVQQAFDARIEPLHQQTYDATVTRAAMAVADGMSEADLMNHMGTLLARDAGGDPAEHAQTVAMGFHAFQSQAVAAVASAGVAPEHQAAIYEWARSTEQGRSDLQQALVALTTTRSTKGFKALAESFLSKASPTKAQLEAHGFITRGNGSDLEVHRVDGAWMLAAQLRFERSTAKK